MGQGVGAATEMTIIPARRHAAYKLCQPSRTQPDFVEPDSLTRTGTKSGGLTLFDAFDITNFTGLATNYYTIPNTDFTEWDDAFSLVRGYVAPNLPIMAGWSIRLLNPFYQVTYLELETTALCQQNSCGLSTLRVGGSASGDGWVPSTHVGRDDVGFWLVRPIPEPSTFSMLAFCGIAMAGYSRLRRRRK
jgi:hypothetical protein